CAGSSPALGTKMVPEKPKDVHSSLGFFVFAFLRCHAASSGMRRKLLGGFPGSLSGLREKTAIASDKTCCHWGHPWQQA
ncbi:MAG: hypothetical protein ACI33N_02685, partial [Desulfovibrionaceae bacterium]